jgi:hypothetical protein
LQTLILTSPVSGTNDVSAGRSFEKPHLSHQLVEHPSGSSIVVASMLLFASSALTVTMRRNAEFA